MVDGVLMLDALVACDCRVTVCLFSSSFFAGRCCFLIVCVCALCVGCCWFFLYWCFFCWPVVLLLIHASFRRSEAAGVHSRCQVNMYVYVYIHMFGCFPNP